MTLPRCECPGGCGGHAGGCLRYQGQRVGRERVVLRVIDRRGRTWRICQFCFAASRAQLAAQRQARLDAQIGRSPTSPEPQRTLFDSAADPIGRSPTAQSSAVGPEIGRSPTTAGPPAETPAAGGLDAFLATPDGVRMWDALLTAVKVALAAGERRFSTRTFLARYRESARVRLNDHWTPALADYVVDALPAADEIVERRKRTATPTTNG